MPTTQTTAPETTMRTLTPFASVAGDLYHTTAASLVSLDHVAGMGMVHTVTTVDADTMVQYIDGTFRMYAATDTVAMRPAQYTL